MGASDRALFFRREAGTFCGAQRPACKPAVIFFARASFTGSGGLRGALFGPEFGGFEAADFVTFCGDSALGATALRTDTAGPPGQPERLSLRGLSSCVVARWTFFRPLWLGCFGSSLSFFR